MNFNNNRNMHNMQTTLNRRDYSHHCHDSKTIQRFECADQRRRNIFLSPRNTIERYQMGPCVNSGARMPVFRTQRKLHRYDWQSGLGMGLPCTEELFLSSGSAQIGLHGPVVRAVRTNDSQWPSTRSSHPITVVAGGNHAPTRKLKSVRRMSVQAEQGLRGEQAHGASTVGWPVARGRA